MTTIVALLEKSEIARPTTMPPTNAPSAMRIDIRKTQALVVGSAFSGVSLRNKSLLRDRRFFLGLLSL